MNALTAGKYKQNGGTQDPVRFPNNYETDMSGVIVLADTISDMGALAKFVFSGDDNRKSVTMETTMTVADFSRKGLGVSGTIMLSAFLPKCM
jgi:hypothetical protein